VDTTYIFGYGNLINPRELDNTLPGKIARGFATLHGWSVTFAKPGLSHVYATLVEDPAGSVMGVLIEVTLADVAAMAQREAGYRLVNISDGFTSGLVDGSPIEDAEVHAFIAPTVHDLRIRGVYLENIFAGLPDDETRRRWLDMVDLDDRGIDRDRSNLPHVQALFPS